MAKEVKNKRSTLGTLPSVEFNTDHNRVSLSNVMMAGKYLEITKDVSINAGISVLHGMVDFLEIVERGFDLVEGSMKEVIAGLISQLGYSPTPDMVNATYLDVHRVVELSVNAHALLVAMHKIQNGRQSTDVNGTFLGTALFKYNHLAVMDSGSIYTTLTTNFDEKISNAVWISDYVNRLQNTYTTASMRAIISALIAPTFVLTEGISSKNSYANLWPHASVASQPDLDVRFNLAVSEIKTLTAANPFIVQILSYLGFETGSEFDFTRALDQKQLTLVEDSGFLEMLMATTVGRSTAGGDSEIEESVARWLFLTDDTPLEISSFASISTISVVNALRFNLDWACFNQMVYNLIDGVWKFTDYNIHPVLLNHKFLPYNDSASDEEMVARLKVVVQKNRAALDQVSAIDFDSCFSITTELGGDGTTISTDRMTIYGGYGSYVLDKSSAALAEQASCTGIVFGADYKSGFADLINQIPANIIKFK